MLAEKCQADIWPSTACMSTVHWPGTGSTSFHITMNGVSMTVDSALSPSDASNPDGFLRRREPEGLSLKKIIVVSVLPGAMSSDEDRISLDATEPWASGASCPLASERRMLSAKALKPSGTDRGNTSSPDSFVIRPKTSLAYWEAPGKLMPTTDHPRNENCRRMEESRTDASPSGSPESPPVRTYTVDPGAAFSSSRIFRLVANALTRSASGAPLKLASLVSVLR